jgi:nucleotide-binding universal stress UspA family protein
MSYKTILVHANGSAQSSEQVKVAARLAKIFDAHLIGTALTDVSWQYYMPDALGEYNLGLAAAIEYLQEQAEGMLRKFESIAQQMGVTSFEKRLQNDETGTGLSLQARYSDITVIGQINPDTLPSFVRSDFPEYLLMHSGRPVLIVPYSGTFEQMGKKVLVAWDGSIQATHAVTAAIPLLQQAESVQVIVFNAEGQSIPHGEQPGADIALYLARQGVKVNVQEQSTPSDIDIGNALLSHAADLSVDLIVMGCYAHSRFREIMLGGVTRTILSSMTVPVLMSH